MRIQLRHLDTASDWESSSFVLAQGEAGVALDTGEARFGNGSDVWENLPTSNGGVKSVAGRTGAVILTKDDVLLNNVDNTPDISKPISGPQQSAISNLQTQINNLAETGGVTAASIGLGNVDNTSDANKPISTATQAALNLKAPINNPIFTGNVQGITPAMIGLAQVNNTADLNKPVSTAQQTALDGKVSTNDPRLSDQRTPINGSVLNSSVATGAGISLDKTADSATRVAMQPAERTTLATIAPSAILFGEGVIKAGVNALASLPANPTNAVMIGIGANALQHVATVNANPVLGIGASALNSITSPNHSFAFGNYSLQSDTSGLYNFAFGQYSSNKLTTANYTSSIGYYAGAGRNNTSDVGIGRLANAGGAAFGLSGNLEVPTVIHSGSTEASNVAIGVQALQFNASSANVAVGGYALDALTTEGTNTAVGYNSLTNLGMDLGPQGKAIVNVGKNGTYIWSATELDIAVASHGVQAGDFVTLQLSGGTFATTSNVRGVVNTVVDPGTFTITTIDGTTPIQSLSDTGNVTLVSYERVAGTTTHSGNVSVGYNSGSQLVSGINNTFVGKAAGPSVTFASSGGSTAIGSGALANATNLTSITALGFNAGSTVGTATRSVFVGDTTAGASTSNNVTVIGSNAASSGDNATVVGQLAMAALNGTAIGSGATSTNGGISIGVSSTSNNSTVVGSSSSASGTDSVVLGGAAVGGYNSSVIGYTSTAADNGIVLGMGSSAAATGIAIGNGITAAATTAEFATNTHTTNINGASVNIGTKITNANILIGGSASTVNIGTSNTSGNVTIHGQLVTIDDAGSTSDERDKTDIRPTTLGLDFIYNIHPVEYRWAKRGESTEGTRFHQGVIAQQVKEAADALGTDFAGYIDQKVKGGPDKLMVRYDEFIGPMILAIQELSDKIDRLEAMQNGEAW